MPLNPRSAAHLVAGAQELVDDKPAGALHALEWSVAAYFLGDATALAILTLRDDASHGRP